MREKPIYKRCIAGIIQLELVDAEELVTLNSLSKRLYSEQPDSVDEIGKG